MRDRAEIRENEMYIRDGEDMRIQRIRDNMARVLDDAEIDSETRKEKLAMFKEEIELILDERNEREHQFIEQELQRHQQEQELEQEIEEEEKKLELANENGKAQQDTKADSLGFLYRTRSSLVAGAEQMRKEIEENRSELTEDEQFSTILINNSARDKIPDFTSSRRRKSEEEQAARIDTIVIKQREIGLMYRDSQELQKSQLKKTSKTPPPEYPPERDDEFDDEE
jgi:hypothetical protein